MTAATTETTDILDRKLERAFELMDSDANGELVEGDLLVLADRLAAAFERGDDPARKERLRNALHRIWQDHLAGMDDDGNGYVDVAEFTRGFRAAARDNRGKFLADLSEVVAAWMDLVDVNGNGRIDVDEYRLMYESAFGITPEDLEYGFRQLDHDDSGELDEQELRQATEEYYTSSNPDAPGNWLFGPL
ncbi:EF-hand domain-containing protein [Streptomyces ochraceiscleroticus]|uniref:EF-hand domain-containing protein n=1 Tax=Streptomyces ochraceiscleroticus TaxID=47761 RepID=A0ABW1MUI0_9ACTN|nr:EF-hand domain-containing protein [Streptomyces ochraceiscleroticus]